MDERHPIDDYGPRATTQDRFLLTVVVPLYNEEQVVAATHERLVAVLGSQPFDLEIIYVNDGSRDETERILHEFSDSDHRVRVISFSRNFGHQPAVSAGLAHARGDAVAVIDGDLQDPPEAIRGMIELWRAGNDVVYGIRTKRKEGAAKRLAYAAFYRIYRRLAEIDVSVDSGDFCLLDRKVVDVINALPEKNRFVRGLRSWVGFRQAGLRYERNARFRGETKYPFTRLVKLAFDGIVNFSTVPLRLIFLGGVTMFLVSLAALGFVLVQRILDFRVFGVSPHDVPGWTSLSLIFLAFSGVQLVSVGILGEYLGRVYQEVKNRPAYVLKEIHGTGASNESRPPQQAILHTAVVETPVKPPGA